MPGGERTKLLDFGIAKLVEDDAAAFRTWNGAAMGTPAYMAPEQCHGPDRSGCRYRAGSTDRVTAAQHTATPAQHDFTSPRVTATCGHS